MEEHAQLNARVLVMDGVVVVVVRLLVFVVPLDMSLILRFVVLHRKRRKKLMEQWQKVCARVIRRKRGDEILYGRLERLVVMEWIIYYYHYFLLLMMLIISFTYFVMNFGLFFFFSLLRLKSSWMVVTASQWKWLVVYNTRKLSKQWWCSWLWSWANK